MIETLTGLRSPRLLKRERNEDDDLEKPSYTLDSKSFDSLSISPLNVPNLPDETLNRASSCMNMATSPARSSTGSLSNAETMTPPPPTALAALVAQPPRKRVKLTLAEKEEKRMLKAVRDQEKADERANRETERRAKEKEKTRKDAEKDAERKRKEAQKEERKLVKETERAEKEKERKARDDEKLRKEQEKRRLEEEKKKKKEGAQPKLNAFFKSNRASKEDSALNPLESASGRLVHSASVSSARCPIKSKAASYYEETFPPFFVQSSVKISPPTQFTRDESASKALQDTIDAHLCGCGNFEGSQSFDAARLFNLPETRLKSRGKKIHSVREIMSHIHSFANRPIDLTTTPKELKINYTRELLKTVPFKILSFEEDIRPAYKGTFTRIPISSMQKLACNPTRRDLPDINYDNDSEDEWEGDDGEDIETEGDEDEDVGEGDDDLDEFLDDTEVETVNERKDIVQADLEPVCSGLCWEDERGYQPNAVIAQYRMELITENARIHFPIDPFSKHYWDTPTAARLMGPPRAPLNAMQATSARVNGPNNPLKLLGATDVAKVAHDFNMAPTKVISADDMPALRQAIKGSQLSKVGLIEVLKKQFPKIPKSSIKYTLEMIAKRIGSKEAEKRWVLIDEGET